MKNEYVNHNCLNRSEIYKTNKIAIVKLLEQYTISRLCFQTDDIFYVINLNFGFKVSKESLF